AEPPHRQKPRPLRHQGRHVSEAVRRVNGMPATPHPHDPAGTDHVPASGTRAGHARNDAVPGDHSPVDADPVDADPVDARPVDADAIGAPVDADPASTAGASPVWPGGVPADMRQTALAIAAAQLPYGAVPWPDGHVDPWDHVECAMALSACGLTRQARL